MIPYLKIEGVFSYKLCDRLMKMHSTGSRSSGFMFPNEAGEVVERIEPSLKVRDDHYVDDKTVAAGIMNRISRIIVPALARRNLHPNRVERHLVARYPVGGHFAAHRDDLLPGTMHRQWAVTINLNNNYVGGELVFPRFGCSIRAQRGEAIVFPCDALHSALPVTKGERFAYLTFLYTSTDE